MVHRNDPTVTRVHTQWFVKPPRRGMFGEVFRLSEKDKAEAYALLIGGSVHKMDQFGSTIKK